MRSFVWIYALGCLVFIKAFSSVPNASLSTGAKLLRRNSKMSKEFPYPWHVARDVPGFGKFLPKQPFYGNISAEVNEIPDEVHPKIVNGREAEEGEFPWMVALYYDNRFTCSAFLISPTIVMTAAHCVVSREDGLQPATAFHGIVGNNNRSGPETRIEFSEVLAHPDYGQDTEGDIALFRTTAPVEPSDRIQTICLPEAGRKYDGENVQAVGWGVTSTISREAPERLMTTDLQVLSQGLCSAFFTFFGIRITDRHVCVNSRRATGACFGDSGGPLVYRNTTSNRPLAIGVTSFGTLFGCGRPYIPTVYTATSAYTDWIRESAGNDSGICFNEQLEEK